jgi:two-component system sensor histidine kinase TctE
VPNSKKEQRSLFGEILDWMLAPLLLLWPMSVALTWLVAQNIAHKPFDRELGEMVRVLGKQVALKRTVGGDLVAEFTLPASATEVLHTDEDDNIYYQVLGLRGELLSGERSLPVPPDEERAPPGEIRFRDDAVENAEVRIAYAWVEPPGQPGNAMLVQVAETLGKRSRLATEIIKGVILPQFVILPLAVLLVWFALSRGIAPLAELQQRIRRRAADDLSPIDETQAPEEVAPLVRAINDLLARLDRSFAAQKRFLADAAHQLKTPLAGLRTQAEVAQREIDLGERGPEALKRSLQQMALASQRAAHMVNQLLAMARAEDREQVMRRTVPVDMVRLATETVREFVPRALERRIDLGYEGPGADGAAGLPQAVPLVRGHPVLLHELLVNLVDNALHYTPAGGTVTVRLFDDPFGEVVVLQVEDSGPGIPATERELVFQPFYRALGTEVDGSGLGLAIVAEIARQHGASLDLSDTCEAPTAESPTPGARFTLRFARLRVSTQAEAGVDPNEVHP